MIDISSEHRSTYLGVDIVDQLVARGRVGEEIDGDSLAFAYDSRLGEGRNRRRGVRLGGQISGRLWGVSRCDVEGRDA